MQRWNAGQGQRISGKGPGRDMNARNKIDQGIQQSCSYYPFKQPSRKKIDGDKNNVKKWLDYRIEKKHYKSS
jgi:hypothetical protein